MPRSSFLWQRRPGLEGAHEAHHDPMAMVAPGFLRWGGCMCFRRRRNTRSWLGVAGGVVLGRGSVVGATVRGRRACDARGKGVRMQALSLHGMVRTARARSRVGMAGR